MTNLRIVPMNWHDAATLSSSAAMVVGFEVENTQNSIRSRVMRTTSAASQWVGGVLPEDRKASFFGMFRHRCHGGSVQVVLYSGAGFSGTVYDSGALPVLNVVGSDVYDFGIDVNALGGSDPFVLESPYWVWFPEVTFRSYKVFFSSKSVTYGFAYWQVSRFFLGNAFEVLRNPDWGANLGFVDKTDRNRSRGGSLRTNVGPVWRVLSFDFVSMLESERAPWLDIMRQCGTGREFVISFFPEDADRRERDHTFTAKFTSLDGIGRPTFDTLSKRVQMEET